jgi:hypothetical protein
MPHDVWAGNIGSLEGLVMGLTFAKQQQQRRGMTQQVLSDVNIFYRSLKLMYGVTFSEHNVRGVMNQVPLQFGVWHAYAHCVKRCYAVFKSFWACLEYQEMLAQPDQTHVYSYPKLVTLEHLLVAMFLARAEIQKRLEDTLAKNNADVLVDRTKWQLVMLQRLLFDFVPTLMHLGISVRRCYWEGRAPNTGDWVRQALCGCLTFLVAVDNRGSSEYIRSLGLTLVYWSPFHSALPAAAFVEEALEASLSRLAKMLIGSYHADTVADIGAMYCSLGRASSRKHDLDKPGLSRVFAKRVGQRLSKLVDHIVCGTMPFVGAGKPHKIAGSRLWPAKMMAVPPRVLVASRAAEFYADVLVGALCLVVKSVACTAWDDELVGNLAAGAPALTKQKKRARVEMVEFLEKERCKRKASTLAGERAAKRQAVIGRPVSTQQTSGT